MSAVDGNVLFSYQIYQNDDISFKYLKFFPIRSDECLAFGAILSDGTIICISNLQLLNLANPPDVGNIMKHLKISKCKIDMNNYTVQKSFLYLHGSNSAGIILLDSNNNIYQDNIGIVDSLTPTMELMKMNYLNTGTDIAGVNKEIVLLRRDNITIDCYKVLDTMVLEKHVSFLAEVPVKYIASIENCLYAHDTNVFTTVLATEHAYYTHGIVADCCMLLDKYQHGHFSSLDRSVSSNILIDYAGSNNVKVYRVGEHLHRMYESLIYGMSLDDSTILQGVSEYATRKADSTACMIGYALAQGASGALSTERNQEIMLAFINNSSYDGAVLCLLNVAIGVVAATNKLEAVLHAAKQYFMNKYHGSVYHIPGFIHVCDLLKSLQYLIMNNMSEKLATVSTSSRLHQQWLLHAKSYRLPAATLLYNLLLARECSVISIADIALVVKGAPMHVDAQNIIDFVNHHVTRIIRTCCDKQQQLLSLAVELSKRALEIEKADGDAFNSLELSSLCVKYTQLIPVDANNTAQSNLISHINMLNLYLRMKLSFLVQCNHPVTVEDIKRDGIKGIVFNILWSFDISGLESHIKLVIIPLLKEYKEDFNAVLADWITVNVNKKLLFYDATVDNVDADEDSYDSCSDAGGDDDNNLLRLLMTVNLLDNYDTKVKLILLLLSVPSIEKYPTSPFLAFDTGGEYLIDLANRLIGCHEENSNYNLKESLTEAIRLYRMKTIARVYGIRGIDPRNPRHVRAAVALISANTVGAQPIMDAMDFINAWSTANYDMSGMLTRALVHRAAFINNKVDIADTDGYNKESNIRALISVIPSTLNPVLIVQDAIDCMNVIYDDICHDLNENIDTEHNLLYGNAVLSGLIALIMVFNSTPACQTNSIARLLLEYKRIFYLFQDGQYISLLRIRDKTVCKQYGLGTCLFVIYVTYSLTHILNHAGIANKRCNELVSVKIVTSSLVLADVITPAMHRLGELLQLTPIFYLHTMLKIMISRHELTFAYAIADLLFQEGNHVDSGNSVSKTDDIKSLHDAAILLCSLPMRGDAVAASSSSVSTENFILSNKLLCSLCTYCPSPALTDVVSLLNNTELITSIFSRIEGYIPTTGSVSASKLSSTMFTKDGLLMSPATIIRPLFNYILNELHRRLIISILLT